MQCDLFKLYKMLKVLKFGGTSMGCAENMRRVARIIGSEGAKITVLSAMAGTTDFLVAYAKEGGELDKLVEKYTLCVEELLTNKGRAEKLIKSTFERIKKSKNSKEILAQGELLTSAIFTMYLKESGVDAVLLNAPDFIIADEELAPKVSDITRRMVDFDAKGETVYITQGFICSNHKGGIDNLGRGGSDYSAALFGAAVGASEVQIWTDIDGMHNNDPRFVEGTYPIRSLHFEEAAELAYFGAKILHPATIQPCKERDIPVKLKNSMEPAALGTIITNKSSSESDFVAVAAKDNITDIRITSTNMLMAYGFLRQVFEVFERYRTPIDMIATSEVAVSLTIDNDTYLESIIKELKDFGHIEVEQNNSIVCVVGKLGQSERGRVLRVLESICTIPVKMISYGASNRSISFLVSTADKKAVLNHLNNHLFVC